MHRWPAGRTPQRRARAGARARSASGRAGSCRRRADRRCGRPGRPRLVRACVRRYPGKAPLGAELAGACEVAGDDEPTNVASADGADGYEPPVAPKREVGDACRPREMRAQEAALPEPSVESPVGAVARERELLRTLQVVSPADDDRAVGPEKEAARPVLRPAAREAGRDLAVAAEGMVEAPIEAQANEGDTMRQIEV